MPIFGNQPARDQCVRRTAVRFRLRLLLAALLFVSAAAAAGLPGVAAAPATPPASGTTL